VKLEKRRGRKAIAATPVVTVAVSEPLRTLSKSTSGTHLHQRKLE